VITRIEEFIGCKSKEEKKAWTLIDAGYDGSFDGEAYKSSSSQNSNNRARTDDFMEAVQKDAESRRGPEGRRGVETKPARAIWRAIASGLGVGDPAPVRHDDQRVAHVVEHGAHNASNP